ncbi:polysaccharide biosynthesis/export family protein [Roseococcus microcysteis]|uniref:polysaccharide biosynthesis/export family protein n=1 Tax=Roseococcus microcysteis TaxID=2771361 RepID=UPI00168BC8DB|nr:polysaccharide biosynthesis/export family protein [Roseococcus microcysteis]
MRLEWNFLGALAACLFTASGAFAQAGMTPQQAAQLRALQGQAAAPGGGAAVQGLMLGAQPGATGTARAGTETEAEAGAGITLPLGEGMRPAGLPMAVFGAALFTGTATSTSDAPNPNYVLAIGDRLNVRVWGAVEAEVSGIVDPEGNFFLPNIGPVRVAGTRAGDLQSTIENELRRTYTQQVQVYAVLVSAQRIGVFVTGFVRTPGRFSGSAADSVLEFLVRAGGVDPTRGSYRDITIMRGGRNVATVDLYRFLIDGRLPTLRMQDGDTVLVGRQRALVGATGAVRNNFLFEVPGRVMSGRELTEYSRPLPAATNAVIQGSRDGRPFSRYVSLNDFQRVTLTDQDTVTFITDSPAQTIRVTVEGSRIGPSVLVADREATLCQALDYIAVDPTLADTASVFLLRTSVANQQRRALNEAADRLERQLFTAISQTAGVAAIRNTEAQLVSTYLQRARTATPDGRVVVMDSQGRCGALRLEEGDVIVIPERSNTVFVSGEVGAPRSIIWQPNLRAEDYIAQAGGFSERGSASNLLIRRPSGERVVDLRTPLRPGDEIIALPRLDPRYLQLGMDLTQIVFQTALAARAFR